jgi:hypothetical protein
LKGVLVSIVAPEIVISVTYSEGVFVALIIQHAMRMFSEPYYILTCGLPVSTLFFFTLIDNINGKTLGKKIFVESRSYAVISSATFVEKDATRY